MKERPILFSGPMVRALLNGSKTQTRRIVKPQFAFDAIPCEMGATNEHGHQISGHSGMWWCQAEGNHEKAVRCPYGQPGDRLWVRETWIPDPPCDGTWAYTEWAGCRIGRISAVPEQFRKPEFCMYRADFSSKAEDLQWTPGIHMPRWASRILLEVTGVRVERLQDISMLDAKAEGVEESAEQLRGLPACLEHCYAYEDLWKSINGPGSWEANQWVWVIEFKRVEAA